eukprot:1388083-Pleurochrysis_carterae.AAC.1
MRFERAIRTCDSNVRFERAIRTQRQLVPSDAAVRKLPCLAAPLPLPPARSARLRTQPNASLPERCVRWAPRTEQAIHEVFGPEGTILVRQWLTHGCENRE